MANVPEHLGLGRAKKVPNPATSPFRYKGIRGEISNFKTILDIISGFENLAGHTNPDFDDIRQIEEVAFIATKDNASSAGKKESVEIFPLVRKLKQIQPNPPAPSEYDYDFAIIDLGFGNGPEYGVSWSGGGGDGLMKTPPPSPQ